MATRAATFTSKIRNLKEYHYKIINNVAPLPTGVDIANTLKYFSQTLLSVLKDVPNIPVENYGLRQKDSIRLSIFPTLNYSGLYQAVLSILDLVPNIQIGQLALGEAVLNVLGWLVPFLEHDLLDALPYTVATTLAIFPPTLHKDTIDLLCTSLLPMTLSSGSCDEPTYASESAAAIITMVFQHTENGAFHSQILECFMSMKKNVIKDILSIIAYGPSSAKAPAAHLLFYYWPQLNPALSDRRGIHYKYCAWPAILCQRKGCINEGNCQAVKMCINPALAIHSGDSPPPLYICSDCAQTLKKDHAGYMVDLLMPMPHVSSVCENKVDVVEFTCLVVKLPLLSTVVLHTTSDLLKEATPIGTKRMVEMGEDLRRMTDDDDSYEVEDAGERKLLSRYGIWLLVELCKPAEDIPIEVLGRLLGMLFQWFDATAYLPDDNIGNAIERLKPEIWDYVMPYWLEAIRTEVPEDELHELKVLLSKAFDIDMCPLPFTLVKMYNFISDRFNDASAAVMEQALQWLQILSSLDIVIPMHQILKMFKCGVDKICTDVDAPELLQQDVMHCHSVLTPGSPLREHAAPLSPERFPNIPDPFDLYDKESELVLPCFIMMLDLCLKQMELQEAPQHLGIYNETSREVMALLACMLHKQWDGQHTCDTDTKRVNCTYCQNIALWHQLAARLMEHVCPRDPLKIPNKELPKIDDIKHQTITEAQNESNDQEEESEDPVFDTSTMPVYLQLYDALLESLVSVTDVDALFAVLSSLTYLILHGECLNYTINQYSQFITLSFRRRFIPNLWKHVQTEHSQLATMCVPLLLHCITLLTGSQILWSLVEQDFGHDDWKARFAAVEKVTVLARFLEPEVIRSNHIIMTSLAHSFCHLIGSVEDINAAVAQRAIMFLETIRPTALKCLVSCLEFQFDSVIEDRSLILHRVQLLETALKDVQILTWEFFLCRFDTLSLEAQVDLESTGDIPYPTDLTSSDRHSETFLKKLNRARFALARTDSVRSVSQSMKGRPPYRRAISVPLHLITKGVNPPKLEKEKSCIRQWSAPQFSLPRRIPTKLNLGNFGSGMFPGGQLREFTDEESNFAALLQRAMDLEGVDRDTVYQLVALLMMFMVHCNDNEDSEENPATVDSKAQNIVLRHLNVLLGYNQTEKSFSVPPFKLRSSAVFNAFISGVMFVLDRNFKLGYVILPITLLVLQYCPSPQRYASDYQPPTYTLWYLEPHTRVSWLKSLLVILYKYQISSSPRSAIIQTLIQLVINTVSAQHHRCKNPEDGFPPPSPTVQRNFSKLSVSDLENIQETDTPPQSPSSQKQDCVGGTVEVRPHPANVVHYFKSSHSQADESSEGITSDAEGTPPNSFPLMKEGSRKAKERHPRRLIEFSEPESADDDSKDNANKKMAQQLREFSVSSHHTVHNSVLGQVNMAGPSHSVATSSSVTTECSREPGTTSDHSRDGISDDTSDDSDKTQTSEGESAGEGASEEQKDDLSEKNINLVLKPNFRQRRPRKTGLTTIDFQKKFPELREEKHQQEEFVLQARSSSRRSRKAELLAKQHISKKTTANRHNENVMVERCSECNAILEQYDDDTIGLCIINLATFIHREPGLATPKMLDMLQCVASIASGSQYSWQAESNIIIPGNCVSIARQFLRCVLHQLAPNGIFPMLFQSNMEDPHFWKTMAIALLDFTELQSHAPLQYLLEGLNESKNLSQDTIMLLLNNMSTYLNCISLESPVLIWTAILTLFDTFLRRLPTALPSPCDSAPIMKILITLLKVSCIGSSRVCMNMALS
ncbi:Protein unc-79 [Bulinus truncatus]|nr:Protein unc-79 [Bulinus truncatus]